MEEGGSSQQQQPLSEDDLERVIRSLKDKVDEMKNDLNGGEVSDVRQSDFFGKFFFK